MNARDRTGAAALVAAAVTGLIAFALFLAGGALLWANGHYKDADGYLSTGSQRFSMTFFSDDELREILRDAYARRRSSAVEEEEERALTPDA